MRKLLILMLVLGITAGANAAISLSLNGEPAPAEYTMAICETVLIDIQSDDAMPYMAYLKLLDADTGEWVGDMTILPAAGASASVYPNCYGYPNFFELEAKAFPGEVPQVSAGKHFEIEFHCVALGDAVIQLCASDWTTVLQTLTIHQVPEPVTMLLLGLGGLFLRRRK